MKQGRNLTQEDGIIGENIMIFLEKESNYVAIREQLQLLPHRSSLRDPINPLLQTRNLARPETCPTPPGFRLRGLMLSSELSHQFSDSFLRRQRAGLRL
jgi:hypothetical protein